MIKRFTAADKYSKLSSTTRWRTLRGTILICDHSSQVLIDGLDDCRVLIGPTEGSVFVRDCSDCVFTIATKQLRVRNCVQFGAMIDFLSVNPSECEVLYPPLCFMQPTGRYQVAHSGPACRLTVVEVEPRS